MNTVTDIVSPLGDLPVLRTYACRVARQLLLRHKFKDSTAEIFAVEENLVEMAKSKLQEFLLAYFPDDRSRVRLIAIVEVKRVAATKITSEEIDTDIKRHVLNELREMSMDDLIPQVH